MFQEIQTEMRRDEKAKRLKRRAAAHHRVTETLPGVISPFPPFTLFTTTPISNDKSKTSQMAPRFHSQLPQCCRLFNNLLMTAINNVSGLGSAGIRLFDWHCFGWMFVVAVRWLVPFICKDIKNLPHCFIYTVHPPSHWRSSTDLLLIRQTDSFWK